MDSEPKVPVATVPVLIAQPEGHAPPTLAEPASGPVAEMSGALQGGEKPPVAPDAPVAAPVTNGEPAIVAKSAGEPPAPTTTSETKTADPVTTAADTEMKEAPPIESATTEVTAAAPNGAATPAKASNGKRKSTGGVPEHKNKKLNKKKSMPKMTHLDAQPGEYYFARLKSYPPWPSMICDEEMLPEILLSTRPVTTKKADGTYNEPYADGGKKEADRTFPVMFLHTNEFAWIPNTDLQPIDDPKELADAPEKGKSKSLIAAYKAAAEHHDIDYFKEMLAAHADALAAEEEAQREREAAKEAAKAAKKEKKSKRKSEVADEDVDMEDAGDDGKKSKKRKKAVESDDEEKPAKTPKTPKLKLTSPKDPATTEKKKEKKEPKPKSEKRKSKAAVSDEDTPMEEKEPEKPLDPVEEKKAREKEVLFLRHKLQKGFLTRDQAPQEEEMPQMSSYIKKLENYGELEVSIIKATKINKVLKALIKLPSIPKDEEFKFRERSMEMLTKWNKLLGNDSADADEKKDAPATNGVHKEDKEKSEPAAKSAVTDAPVSDNSASVDTTKVAEKTAPAQPASSGAAPVQPSAGTPAKVDEAAPAASKTSIEYKPSMAEVTVAPESSGAATQAAKLAKET